MNVEEEKPRGPRAMAEHLAVNIEELKGKMAATRCEKEKRRISKVLRLNRQMLAWCKTRAGY